MSQEPYILDKPLSPEQNYKLLKAEGLAKIQEWSNSNWSNLNADDPGITILEQLCYALTELGYCLNFSIPDLLTKPDGLVDLKNQFYLPQEILTTAPITVNDYRKYLIDTVSGVRNAILRKAHSSVANARVYKTLLYIDPAIADKAHMDAICTAAYLQLNTCRNLNEYFLKPIYLKRKHYLLQGTLYLNKETHLNTLCTSLQNSISTYIFPSIVAETYSLNKNTTQEGPFLTKGDISNTLGTLKTSFTTLELAQLIVADPTFKTYDALNFKKGDVVYTEITSTDDEILVVDIHTSLLENLLTVVYNGQTLRFESDPTTINTEYDFYHNNLAYTTTPSLQPYTNTFRDINNYYAIQNTFPEIYGVGETGLPTDTSTYRKAQTKQLKGYLTLFDQLLANFFSQAANLSTIFNFKNALTGTPSDETYYYATQTEAQKHRNEYPVPYRVFSPTYFYQSLYTVPDIKPLLKNNNSLIRNTIDESIEKVETDAWIQYKKDPYNTYIAGMMDLVEDEETNLARRNTILNHLLARHGESPLLLDMILNGSRFTANSIKDLVIYKSLYLQNFALLSYNRCKAYSYKGAIPIPVNWPEVNAAYIERLYGRNEIDFIVNLEKINTENELCANDFLNYSALELKIHLLLGLNTIYCDFILKHYASDNLEKRFETDIAAWLLEYRKGTIVLEANLLYQTLNSIFHIRDKKTGKTWFIENVSAEQIRLLHNWIIENNASATVKLSEKNGVLVLDETFSFQETVVSTKTLNWESIQENIHVEIAVTPIEPITHPSIHPNALYIFIPAFIKEMEAQAFMDRLALLLSQNVPVGITPIVIPCNALELTLLIELYTFLHNKLIQPIPEIKIENPNEIETNEKTKKFLHLLHQLLQSKDEQ